ncbi:phosphatidylinositol 3-5-bisphosphate-binding protein [Penicillium canariense]|uniref:Phosphatidylinositol 3-5-bisphosphate-binding protein n=1 Tax=Penicillium canariense TaxID=189055 RepID=A0A9W9II08_9EURO|nr:phosphatidylinositol 3-5-bisphosphate-binding protein [Penicillium canariense]KAJ5176684.1 phosphatidylinositol 3-5-bisphosphate-binding protein [Penicillium canariense]
MNTRQVIDESVGPYSLSAAFNNDSSCFSVGLNTGFCVFNANPCELKVSRGELRECPILLEDHISLTGNAVILDFNAGIGVVEMLGQSNYLAIVGGGRNPKFPQNKVRSNTSSIPKAEKTHTSLPQLVIWDDAKQKAAITLEFRTSVLGVRLSKSRIVIALLNSIHVFAFSTPPQKLSVFETSDNPLGLACLGQKLLAFPGRSPGQVQVIELETGNISIIPAHSSPLRAMALSPDGEVLATASEAGTLIRVFSTANCTKLAELRRGVDHAVIFSLSFSPSNTLLAVTSDKSTLHIFDVPHPHHIAHRSQSPSATEEGTRQKWGILGRLPLLPRVFSDVYSFASTHFEIGEEAMPGTPYVPPIGASLGRPPKGVIGWMDDQTLLVIGSGQDGRWEKFVLRDGDDGRRYCMREGWKRYLGG